MDVLPSGSIFRELQVVHDTGYFSGQASIEEDWHQVNISVLPGGTGPGDTTFGLANSLETIRNFDKRVFADRVLENHIFPLEIRKLFKYRKFNKNV